MLLETSPNVESNRPKQNTMRNISKKHHRSLQSITVPIQEELAIFNDSLRKLQGPNRLLNVVLRYVMRSKGKQIRPILVLLSAGMYGKINENTYSGARLVELIHTATLVHDDVLDEADIRRNFLSVNKIWKNKMAILLGDYLLSTSLLQCVQDKNYPFLDIIAGVVKDMIAGEIFQMQKAKILNISRQEYFEVIYQKTSSLLVACCKIGANSVQASEEALQAIALLGKNLGMMFQVRDDILDYEGSLMGKNEQADLKNKIINLPLLCALEQCNVQEQKEYVRLIRYKNRLPTTQRAILHLVREKKGIQEAEGVIDTLRKESVDVLRSLPDSRYKESFVRLVDYFSSREQ